MIPDITIKGTPVGDLCKSSQQKVERTCDFCGDKRVMAMRDINKQRNNFMKNYGVIKDRCQLCQIKSVSETRFKPIRKEIRYANGYVHQKCHRRGSFQRQHRLVMEEKIGRDLLPEEVVHHLDGDKINNKPSNLLLVASEYEHQMYHKQLESIAQSLYKKGVVIFDWLTRSYKIKEVDIFEESIGFENISIRQLKNKAKSRLDVDCSSEIIKGIVRPTPFIAANMSTVINPDFYMKLYELGAFGFLHRAGSDEARVKDVLELAGRVEFVATSIGIGQKEEDVAKKLITAGANTLVIDIAHGYSDEVINLGRKLKNEYPHVKMILGNTVNPDMLNEISDFADALKVGIAQGFACETKNTAGCTEKQFSAVLKFKEKAASLGMPIISDGGIREPADCVKAIGAGASSIMMGKIFAACPESAGEIVGGQKLYAGMASEHVQNQWKDGLKPGTCAEGGVRMLDVSDSIDKVLERYTGALRSGITYAGSLDIKEFQRNVQWIKLT